MDAVDLLDHNVEDVYVDEEDTLHEYVVVRMGPEGKPQVLFLLDPPVTRGTSAEQAPLPECNETKVRTIPEFISLGEVVLRFDDLVRVASLLSVMNKQMKLYRQRDVWNKECKRRGMRTPSEVSEDVPHSHDVHSIGTPDVHSEEDSGADTDEDTPLISSLLTPVNVESQVHRARECVHTPERPSAPLGSRSHPPSYIAGGTPTPSATTPMGEIKTPRSEGVHLRTLLAREVVPDTHSLDNWTFPGTKDKIKSRDEELTALTAVSSATGIPSNYFRCCHALLVSGRVENEVMFEAFTWGYARLHQHFRAIYYVGPPGTEEAIMASKGVCYRWEDLESLCDHVRNGFEKLSRRYLEYEYCASEDFLHIIPAELYYMAWKIYTGAYVKDVEHPLGKYQIIV